MATNETLDPEVLREIEPFQGIAVGGSGSDIVQSGQALQRVETPYTTAVAVQQPRSLTKVVKNVLEEARLARSAFYYKWSVKGSKRPIQGGSIDLARSIARNFGNVAVDIIEEPETMTHFKFKAVFIDLESGLNWPRLFRQRKGMNTGMADKERAEDIIFQIGQSKAQRNAVYQGVPGWLVDKAIEVAEQAEISGIKNEGIEIARIKVIDFFTQYGADEERIEAKLGKKSDKWMENDIADLRAIATAIKEGRVSIGEVFPQVEENKKEPPIKGTVDPLERPKEPPKKAGRPKGSTSKQPDSGKTNILSPQWESWRREWINLRNIVTFKEYFESALDMIYSAPSELRMRFAEKFQSIFSMELPGDLNSAQILIQSGYKTYENPEGESEGEQEKTDPELPEGAQRGEDIEALINSDMWAALQDRKGKFPQFYLRVTRGQTPKTIAEVEAVINEIDFMAAGDQGPGIPGA